GGGGWPGARAGSWGGGGGGRRLTAGAPWPRRRRPRRPPRGGRRRTGGQRFLARDEAVARAACGGFPGPDPVARDDHSPEASPCHAYAIDGHHKAAKVTIEPIKASTCRTFLKCETMRGPLPRTL